MSLLQNFQEKKIKFMEGKKEISIEQYREIQKKFRFEKDKFPQKEAKEIIEKILGEEISFPISFHLYGEKYDERLQLLFCEYDSQRVRCEYSTRKKNTTNQYVVTLEAPVFLRTEEKKETRVFKGAIHNYGISSYRYEDSDLPYEKNVKQDFHRETKTTVFSVYHVFSFSELRYTEEREQIEEKTEREDFQK